ncbi:MAG: acyloxyacyl hydrolase [Bacteroidota bacterium]|nr:acyloxyacyl hydrolase [uncultured Allomuricauda sp.]
MRRLLLLCSILAQVPGISQNKESPRKYVLDASQFYGSILLHNTDISHLITEHPGGLILGFNRKRYGDKAWEADYGYPDTGFSFVYQNMNNSTLGEHFGLYAHYNFYFFKRNLQLRVGQGIAYNTNPYDKNQNFRNNAYGSHLLSSTMVLLNYHRENLIAGLGFKAGIALLHYSNANFKAPNTSTNTFAFNFGLTYDLDGGETYSLKKPEKKEKMLEPLRYNLVLRGGINESDVIDSGQYGFWIFSGYVDKRLGRKSAIQLGADFFFSNFLKELIRFQSISFPEMEVDADTDFKRIGLFVGHELFINKMSLETQLGYYVYYPFDFEGRVYNRIGLKRYFGDRFFGAVTLKSHGAAAEALEFGIGMRL